MLRIGVRASHEGTTLQSIIDSSPIWVLPGDTVESLRARVQACEREAVVKTLAEMASGELASG